MHCIMVAQTPVSFTTNILIGFGAQDGHVFTSSTEIMLHGLSPYIRYDVNVKSENELASIDSTSMRDTNTIFLTLEGGQFCLNHACYIHSNYIL